MNYGYFLVSFETEGKGEQAERTSPESPENDFTLVTFGRVFVKQSRAAAPGRLRSPEPPARPV